MEKSPKLDLISEAARLGAELPVAIAQQFCAERDVLAVLKALSPASRREPLLHLFRQWPGNSVQTFGTALLTAAVAAEQRRRDEHLELVWTGPDSRVIPVRQTSQVLIDLIADAKQRLLVVSYAVFRIPKIRDALVCAAGRGVRIRIVLDLASDSDIQGYNPLRAVGDELISCSEILYWPEENRKPDAGGKRGLLHVKCLVADGHSLFLSSANLTDQALRLNMELGVLIRGTVHSAHVESHFAELLAKGILKRLEAA